MADTHGPDTHHGPDLVTYLAVFSVLCVCTAISFVFYSAFGPGSLKGAILILLVAVVKALLVGAVFMHLKYDWGNLYFLICPVFIMAAMMIVVLLPDSVLAWHREANDDPTLVKVVSPH